MGYLLLFVALVLAVFGAYSDGRAQGRAEATCEAKCGPDYVLGRDRKCGCAAPASREGSETP